MSHGDEMQVKTQDRIVRGEAKASKHINIVGHYDDDTLIDKSGKLIKIFRLNGVDFITKHDSYLDVLKNRFNSLLKSFTSEYALYFWTIRKRTVTFPGGEFKHTFAKSVNEKYRNKIMSMEMYQNVLYMAVITKQPEGIVNKGLNIFKQLSHNAIKTSQRQYLQKRYLELEEITRKLLSALNEFQAVLLTTYLKDGQKFSEPLEFLGELINFAKHRFPLMPQDAARYLSAKRLFFNRRAGVIEARSGDNNKKFAAVLSIKEYPAFTYQGMLDALSNLKIEYVITQSYRFYDRHITKTKLRDQQKDLRQSKDESISQTEQINEAFDEAASTEFV